MPCRPKWRWSFTSAARRRKMRWRILQPTIRRESFIAKWPADIVRRQDERPSSKSDSRTVGPCFKSIPAWRGLVALTLRSVEVHGIIHAATGQDSPILQDQSTAPNIR